MKILTDMKKFIFACFMLVALSSLNAQSYNPYSNQGVISPSPLLPLEFNGNGVVSFNIGNSGSNPIPYDMNNPTNNMVVVITLNNGIPNKNNPLAAMLLKKRWSTGCAQGERPAWELDPGRTI